MACTCATGCTLVTISGISYCDCPVSQTQTCPAGYTLTNLGGGNMVCRQVSIIDSIPCGSKVCDTANGYTYNDTTKKCEKTILSNPCADGYTFVPTNDGIGKCVPAAGAGTLLCPVGYTYNAINKTCTKDTSNPATATTTTKCKVDIVFVNGLNPVSSQDEKDFIDAFMNSIASEIDSTNFDIRIGVAGCDKTTSNETMYLYSGPGVNPGSFNQPTSTFIKSQYPTQAITSAAQPNTPTQGLVRAASMLYQSTTITHPPGGSVVQLPPRQDVRKIIVYLGMYGPTASGNVPYLSFGTCTGTDITDYQSHYPVSSNYHYREYRRTVNQARCLLANNPSLEIYTVYSGPVDSNNPLTAYIPQLMLDMKSQAGTAYSNGASYYIYSGGGAVGGIQLKANLFALQPKSGGVPAVCGSVSTYSCPVGETLSGTNCIGLDIKPALECDPTCVMSPSGTNMLCTCVLPSVPTLCGPCTVVNSKCACVTQQEPTTYTFHTPISLDDPKYFDKIEWTISYDPKQKMWLSFHDWHPSLMIPALSHFFTIKDKTFWKHNERFDSFTNYYNDGTFNADYGWEVEYNIVTPNAVTTLRSIEYYMEAYKYYNDGKDMFHVLDENFDRAIIYNSEQVSPLLNLKIKVKNNPLEQLSYPIIGPVNTIILASKEENKYRFNTFYDITKDRQEFATSASNIPGFMAPGSGTLVPMFVTAPDGYHKTINPAYVDVLKKPLEHKKFRHFGNKIVLRKTASGDKKMLLKLVNSKILNSSR